MYRIYIIIALAILSFIQFGCYSNMKKDRDLIERTVTAEFEKQIADEKEKQNLAFEKVSKELSIVSSELEAERNNIKIEFRDIKYEAQKIISDRIYKCRFTNDGLRITNKAISSANSNKSND